MKSKLVIPVRLYNKMMYFVNNTDNEISGMGRLVFSNGIATVSNIYLLEQEVGPATTDIDEASLAKLMFESRNDIGAINFWWHSHVNMNSFFSSTDNATIEEIGGKGFVIAMVVNKKQEYQIVYHAKGSDTQPMIWQDMELEIDYGFGDVEDDWKKEMEAKCKTKTYSTMHNTTFLNQHDKYMLNNDHRNIWNRYQQRFTSNAELMADEAQMNGETVVNEYISMDYWDKDDWKDEFIQQHGRIPAKGELSKFRKKTLKEFKEKK